VAPPDAVRSARSHRYRGLTSLRPSPRAGILQRVSGRLPSLTPPLSTPHPSVSNRPICPANGPVALFPDRIARCQSIPPPVASPLPPSPPLGTPVAPRRPDRGDSGPPGCLAIGTACESDSQIGKPLQIGGIFCIPLDRGPIFSGSGTVCLQASARPPPWPQVLSVAGGFHPSRPPS